MNMIGKTWGHTISDLINTHALISKHKEFLVETLMYQHLIYCHLKWPNYSIFLAGQCSGSVVECLIQDEGVAGLKLIGITALCL